MGFTTPDLPDIDYDTWKTQPRSARIQTMARHWVEHGFGTPVAVYILYVVKIALYVGGAAAVISLTPGLGGLTEIDSWWTQPIVYQKVVLFTLLFEILGFGCGSGPLTMRFLPPVGGFLYWLRPGTIRLPPWPNRIPLTRGDERTVVDVALYAMVLISGVWALLSAGHNGPVTGAGDVGLIEPVVVIPLIAALAVLGLRDKTVFLAARAEQYGLTLFIFFFPFIDQIVGFKLVLLALWWGAATSKLNHHFPYVVAVMMSNSPVLRSTWIKKKMYLDPVNDLRPSWLPKLIAHGGGTTMEFLVPLYLVFFAHPGPIMWVVIAIMVLFHLNIISTVPMGVPLEWNVFFIFSLFYLFGHYGSIRVTDLDSPLLLVILVTALALIPIAGNMFPKEISFLPAMRYYAGNWATSTWCFADGAEQKIEDRVTKSSALPAKQLEKLYDRETADIMMQKVMSWRSLHLQGRALNGLVPRAIDDEQQYKIRDGELVAGAIIGWNFGEGHLHNGQLLDALQRRCQFEPAEVRVVVLEPQPIQNHRQYYRILDASTGLIEEGYVDVNNMLSRQPWPTEGEDFPVYPLDDHAGKALGH